MHPATIEEKNWGAEPWRQPAEQPGDVLLASEHGRIIDRTDYRSHWYKLVKPEFGGVTLLVKHGGGDERICLGHLYGDAIATAAAKLDPDTRYKLFSALLHIVHEAERNAKRETARKYQEAFLEGRLKKRRKNGSVTVEVL